MAIVLVILSGMAVPALAHEVLHQIRQSRATVITLTFADGQPFGGEAFEAAPVEGGRPILRGRTDAEGRAVVLAELPGLWRLRAWSDDGHGVDLRFEVVASAARSADSAGSSESAASSYVPGSPAAADPRAGRQSPASLPRWVLGLIGVVAIVVAFAGLQRLIRRRDAPGTSRPR